MNCFFVICASLVLVAYSAAQNEGDVSTTTAASESSSTTLTPQQEKLVDEFSRLDITKCTMKVEGCGISNAAFSDIMKGKSMKEWPRCGSTFMDCMGTVMNNGREMSTELRDVLQKFLSGSRGSNSGSGGSNSGSGGSPFGRNSII